MPIGHAWAGTSNAYAEIDRQLAARLGLVIDVRTVERRAIFAVTPTDRNEMVQLRRPCLKDIADPDCEARHHSNQKDGRQDQQAP